uniref:Uncharacterized protein n=1 Tax=Arundo donax TaxID=35708 RepID=A0A0A8YEB4_ARUDO
MEYRSMYHAYRLKSFSSEMMQAPRSLALKTFGL